MSISPLLTASFGKLSVLFLIEQYFYSIEYTKFSNRNDKTSNTERRRAISKLLAYLAHQRKLKAMMVSNQFPGRANRHETAGSVVFRRFHEAVFR